MYVPSYPPTSYRAQTAGDRTRRACWLGLGAKAHRAGFRPDELVRYSIVQAGAASAALLAELRGRGIDVEAIRADGIRQGLI